MRELSQALQGGRRRESSSNGGGGSGFGAKQERGGGRAGRKQRQEDEESEPGWDEELLADLSDSGKQAVGGVGCGLHPTARGWELLACGRGARLIHSCQTLRSVGVCVSASLAHPPVVALPGNPVSAEVAELLGQEGRPQMCRRGCQVVSCWV